MIKAPAKTSAERQAAFKAKQVEKGLVRLTGVWIHPDDIDKIRSMIRAMNKSRGL